MAPFKNPFKSLSEWIAGTMRKRSITISRGDNDSRAWQFHLSPISFVGTSIALVALIFGTLLIVVAYTPLLDLLPGYRTDAGKSREMLMRNLIKLDSLERKVNEMLVYNENRILVVDGKTPTMRTVQRDSLRRDKSIVTPSQADSLLRERMESDPQYRLGNASARNGVRNTINANAPMYGLIAERFDARTGLFGIRISGAPEAQVMAVADGTVVASDWSPEVGNTIIIQHNNGMTSVYRHLSSTMPEKGQRVRGNEVIGYAAAESDKSQLSMLEFELWSEGKPLNPELYIIF